MKGKRSLERLLRAGIVAAGIGLSALIAHSLVSPGKGGPEVESSVDITYGPPRVVLTKYEKATVEYTEMSIYPSTVTDFTDQSQRAGIKPSKVARFERHETKRVETFRERDGTKADNQRMKVGDGYTLQFDLPVTMKSLQVVYGGLKHNTRMWEHREKKAKGDKITRYIAKTDITIREGVQKITAEVEYENGQKDYFDVRIEGQP